MFFFGNCINYFDKFDQISNSPIFSAVPFDFSALQVLWEHVQPSQNSSIYNGGVEAVSGILSRLHNNRSQMTYVKKRAELL